MSSASTIRSLFTTFVLLGLVQSLMGETLDPLARRVPASAVGFLEGFPPHLRRAFKDTPQFNPLPNPGPHDWLTQYSEAGQTFDQFLSAPHHRPDRHRNRLYLLPLGEFSRDRNADLGLLRQFTAAFFAMEVDLLPALDLKGVSISGRQNPNTMGFQLDGHEILRLLRRELPDDAFALLGITMLDLYPDPSWNFVFGLASPTDRVGVFSLARYDPSFYGEVASESTSKLMLRRSCKVLAHEIGHIFGIGHCVFFHCLMNGSNHLDEIDARPLHLCPIDLRKLQNSIGFDPVTRYGGLLQFTRQVGLENDARWLTERLDHLEGK